MCNWMTLGTPSNGKELRAAIAATPNDVIVRRPLFEPLQPLFYQTALDDDG